MLSTINYRAITKIRMLNRPVKYSKKMSKDVPVYFDCGMYTVKSSVKTKIEFFAQHKHIMQSNFENKSSDASMGLSLKTFFPA